MTTTLREPTAVLLPAASPAQWLATHPHAEHAEPTPGGRWVTADEVLADGAGLLRALHARLREDQGAPPAAAAKWLVGWFAGGLADAVGFMVATAAAAPLVHRDHARWRLHPDGWPERVDVGAVPVAVPAAHPWAGLPGTVAVADEAAVAARAVPSLVAAVAPLVEAGRSLARVGRTTLWAEVADGLGLPVLRRPDAPADDAVVRRLRLLLAAAGAPWRARPDLRLADTADGPAYLGRKGGCCLAYQCPEPEPAEPLDERERAQRERPAGGPRYCSTCSLRDLADCEERQRSWLQQERAARSAVV